ncbi:MAG: hypothetical protein SPF51_02200 [Candidatus Fimivicinus sp.]|nr:hypothetical protein [Oscillospiraceae bacterium]MDY5590346.1 hypothetical protein [Candidatus Fimivicinus sp.]
MPQNPYLRDASGVPDWQLCGFCGQERERFLIDGLRVVQRLSHNFSRIPCRVKRNAVIFKI